jgi:hypothetical protein
MGRSTMSPPTTAPADDAESAKESGRVEEDVVAISGYIADMAGELAQLAGDAELPMVAYFLNLARAEAETRAREHGGADTKREE